MPAPIEIETWQKQAFKDGITHLAQQQGSKLRGAVTLETDLDGIKKFYNQMGSVDGEEITERHPDTPILGTPTARRMITATPWHWGDMVDNIDKLETLESPENDYVIAGSYAWGRFLDSRIVNAFNATAYVGKEGNQTKSLPSSMVIDADLDDDGNNENLSLDKLRRARTLIEDQDVDTDAPMNRLHIACTTWEIEHLLGLDEVISSDYNTVKALADGRLNEYMGFTWHKISPTILEKSGDIRSCFLWAESGMKLATYPELITDVYKRGDKSQNIQVYVWGQAGATRMEETKVVEIKVDVTA